MSGQGKIHKGYKIIPVGNEGFIVEGHPDKVFKTTKEAEKWIDDNLPIPSNSTPANAKQGGFFKVVKPKM